MSFQVIPGEIRHFLARDEEVAGALGELGEVHYIVGGAFCVSVDRGFRPHEADIRLAGNDSGHCFVGAKSAYEFQVDPFFVKVAFLDRHIHRGVEDRVGDFVECHSGFFDGFAIVRAVFCRPVFAGIFPGSTSDCQRKGKDGSCKICKYPFFHNSSIMIRLLNSLYYMKKAVECAARAFFLTGL